MATRKQPSERATTRAFREVTRDEPSIVGRTRRKQGREAARKQRVAIALDKARRSSRRS